MIGIGVLGVLTLATIWRSLSSHRVERNWPGTIICGLIFGILAVVGVFSGVGYVWYVLDPAAFFADPSEEGPAIIGAWVGIIIGLVGIHDFLRVALSLKGACWYSDGPYYPPCRSEDHLRLGEVQVQEMLPGTRGFVVPWHVVSVKRGQGTDYFVLKYSRVSETDIGTACVGISRDLKGEYLISIPEPASVDKSPGVDKKYFVKAT